MELLFTNVLPENRDAQGRVDYLEALNSGILTRGAMVAEFVESFEFVQSNALSADNFVSTLFLSSDDTLIGGIGADILFGGRGTDKFIYDVAKDGADTILDFDISTDTIDLGNSVAFDSFAEILAVAFQFGTNTVFDFGNGNTLTLENTQLTDLSEADFEFSGENNASNSIATKPQVIPVMDVAYEGSDLSLTLDESDFAFDALF